MRKVASMGVVLAIAGRGCWTTAGIRQRCAAAPLPARAIEEFVVERVRNALADGRLAAEVSQAVKERLAAQRSGLLAERKELPSKIAILSSEGKRVVESASHVTGSGRRLLDGKLQEVGDQLARMEARLREVERRLEVLDECEVEAAWVSRCLADFDQVWDSLTAENRGRLVRAVIQRVEVDEPNDDVRVFIADLNPNPAEVVSAIAVNS
jgi:site-specific DNA recombinase